MIAVKAGLLISSVQQVYQNYGFLMEQGSIVDILPNCEIERLRVEQNIEVIDAEQQIVFPGFINAHMHQYGMLSHGMPSEVEITGFTDFLEEFWWPLIENRLTQREVLVTAKASAVEMIKSGVTGFCDTLEAPFAPPGVLQAQAVEIEKIGLRAQLSLESSERVSTDNGLACLAENSNFIKWCQGRSGLVEGLMCTHTTFTCSLEFLRKAKSEANQLGAKLQFHLSESAYEPAYCYEKLGKSPTQHYCELELLDAQTLASQCVQLTEEELALLAQKQVSVVHMPLSNCEVGGGVAPVPKMLELGINVGLGSDGYINDFFTVMKGAFLIHKAHLQNASVMTAKEVFLMATELGAKALGWQNTGTLEVGKQADFVVMDNHFPTPVNPNNIFEQLVTFGQKEYVDSVFVNGKPLLLDKALQTIDEQATMRELKEVATKFWEGM